MAPRAPSLALCFCRRSSPYCDILPTATDAAAAAAWALLPSTSTGCRVRYSLLFCCCCTMLVRLRLSFYFRHSFSWNQPPPTTRFSSIPFLFFLSFLFVPPKSRLFRHSHIVVSSLRTFACSLISWRSPPGRGGGVETEDLPSSSLPSPTPPSPVPSPGYCTRLTCPLLQQITSTTRRPFRSLVICSRLPYCTSLPRILSLAPAVYYALVLPARTLDTEVGSSIFTLTYPINACDAHLPPLDRPRLCSHLRQPC